jgi:hypothetical protein
MLPNLLVGGVNFALLCLASWSVGEGGEILGKKYDASIVGGLLIAWLNTGEACARAIHQTICGDDASTY